MKQSSTIQELGPAKRPPGFMLPPATAVSVVVQILETADIVNARQSGRDVSSTFRASEVETTFITTIISELARNILVHAEKGEIQIDGEDSSGQARITVTARDTGPGIRDVHRALLGGYSTCGRMGLGLSGVRQLADEFRIESAESTGTTVTAAKWLGLTKIPDF